MLYLLSFAAGVSLTCLYVVALLVLRDRRDAPPPDGGAPAAWRRRLALWREGLRQPLD